jgi:hypothetical protein
VERALEANASIVALLGLSLGAFVGRRWFVLPAIGDVLEDYEFYGFI